VVCRKFRRSKETALNGSAGVNSKDTRRELQVPEIRIQTAALLELEDWSEVDVSSVGRPPVDLNAMRMTDSVANIAAVTTDVLSFFSERSRSLYAIARPSVCRLSVTLVRPTQAV